MSDVNCHLPDALNFIQLFFHKNDFHHLTMINPSFDLDFGPHVTRKLRLNENIKV